ncbi:hypothetical protein VTO42DRAFT_492 [Malbranchea cinnamomea]
MSMRQCGRRRAALDLLAGLSLSLSLSLSFFSSVSPSSQTAAPIPLPPLSVCLFPALASRKFRQDAQTPSPWPLGCSRIEMTRLRGYTAYRGDPWRSPRPKGCSCSSAAGGRFLQRRRGDYDSLPTPPRAAREGPSDVARLRLATGGSAGWRSGKSVYRSGLTHAKVVTSRPGCDGCWSLEVITISDGSYRQNDLWTAKDNATF